MQTAIYTQTFSGLKIMIIAAASCILYSCDCNQNVSGTVLDKATKQPIDSAYTQNANKNHDYAYTNRQGYFKLQSISGGFRKCPAMLVAVTKKGYEIKTIEIENGTHDTIYLERTR
jgi:hypothetical protein